MEDLVKNSGGLIRIEGADEVKNFLSQLDQDVQTTIMRAGLRDAGEVVKGAIQERAPIKKLQAAGGRLPPEAIKNDLHVRISGKFGRLMAVVEFGKYTFFVARWVEYGHRLVKGKSNKKVGPGKVIGQVEEHPFIRPAFESSVSAAVEAFANRVGDEVRKKARRLKLHV